MDSDLQLHWFPELQDPVQVSMQKPSLCVISFPYLLVMEDYDKDFLTKIKPGDILIAAENFGCGSSREHAPIAIKAAGISCVIAQSFARIFFRNAINIGLPIFESNETYDETQEGDVIEVDTEKGIISNVTNQKRFQVSPLPDFIQKIISAGGLVEFAKKEMERKKD